MANIATASPTFACSQQVPPAGAGGERCLPRCPRGPRRMGWPGRLGTDEARVTWDMPEGCNSPKVHGSQLFLIRQSDLLLLLCGLLAPFALSLSLVLTSPYRRSFSSPVFRSVQDAGR